MQIKDMFKKSITRDIQGVVIAGQGEKTNIATELEEYVVTPELQRHFADFFSAYAKGRRFSYAVRLAVESPLWHTALTALYPIPSPVR